MALKYRVAKLEEVEEAHRGLYEARDGAFFLAVEGATGKDKLDEFRTNNITLKQQLDDLTARFAGIDPDEAKRLLTEAQKLKDKKMIEAGEIPKLVEERTAAMKAEYEKQIKTLTDTLAKSSTQLERLLIDNAIQSTATKVGVADTAMEDVLLRGRNLFKVQDGKAVPVGPDGKVIYGKDGSTPQSMDEWLGSLVPAAPHLFKASAGGGAKNIPNLPAGTKTMRRSEFEALDATAKMAFSKEKGVVVD